MKSRLLIMIAVLASLVLTGCAGSNAPGRTVDPMFGLGGREQFRLSSELEILPLDGEHHATAAPAAYFAVVSRLFPAPED